jgi:tetratricopeptide (TPR) repeat protein
MLETIRQYAQDRLVETGEAEDVRARHARWYADFARRAGRGLYSSDEVIWDARLPLEIDNLQVAVSWAVGAGATEIAMRIGGSFPRQAVTRPLLGTAHLAEVALGVVGADDHPVRARVLAEAGWAAARRGDLQHAFALLYKSVDEQRAGARFAAAAFTYLLTLQNQDLTAEGNRTAMIFEGLTLAEASGDRVAETGIRSAFASTLAMDSTQWELAEQHAQRALEDARALRQPTLEVAALYSLAQAKFRSDPDAAIALLRASLDLGRQCHSESEEGAALGLLAYVEAGHGDARQAVQALREKTAWEIRNRGLSWAPFFLGTSAFSRVGRHDLVALCEGNSRRFVTTLRYLWDDLHHDEIAEARDALGDETFEQLAARGAAHDVDDFNLMLLQEIDDTLEQLPAT